jgi:hypothetical protein
MLVIHYNSNVIHFSRFYLTLSMFYLLMYNRSPKYVVIHLRYLKMLSEHITTLFVVGESPCGQVDSLLASRLLRPRQKSA